MDMKQLTGLAITLVIIGLVIGIGLLVLIEFEETMGDTTTTVTGETIVPTDAGVFVAYNHTTAGVYCYNSFTVSSVVNQSGDVTIAPGNYTYQPATGRVYNLSSVDGNLGWNVTYTYKSGDTSACEGVGETINATETIPGWLALIVIIAMAGIILFIVFKVIPKAGDIGSSGSSGSSGTVAQI